MLGQALSPAQLQQTFSQVGFSRNERNPPLGNRVNDNVNNPSNNNNDNQPTPLAFGSYAQGGLVQEPGYYAQGGLGGLGQRPGGLTPGSMSKFGTQAHYTGLNVAREIKSPGVHLISSSVPGRTDRIPMRARPGSYVIPADAVSGLGQGNTHAGADMWGKTIAASAGPMGIANTLKARAFKAPPLKMGTTKSSFAQGGDVQEELVPIITAGGEMIVDPELVEALGGGNAELGKKALAKSIMTIRKHVAEQARKLPKPVA